MSTTARTIPPQGAFSAISEVALVCLFGIAFVLLSDRGAEASANPAPALAIWIMFPLVGGFIFDIKKGATVIQPLKLTSVSILIVFAAVIVSIFHKNLSLNPNEGIHLAHDEIIYEATGLLISMIMAWIVMVLVVFCRPALYGILLKISDTDVEFLKKYSRLFSALAEVVNNASMLTKALGLLGAAVLAVFVGMG